MVCKCLNKLHSEVKQNQSNTGLLSTLNWKYFKTNHKNMMAENSWGFDRLSLPPDTIINMSTILWWSTFPIFSYFHHKEVCHAFYALTHSISYFIFNQQLTFIRAVMELVTSSLQNPHPLIQTLRSLWQQFLSQTLLWWVQVRQ